LSENLVTMMSVLC